MSQSIVLPAIPPPVPAASGRIPGSKAMWVGIFCEVTEFALMFAVYFVARATETLHGRPVRQCDAILSTQTALS